jgi:hypothetical protein
MTAIALPMPGRRARIASNVVAGFVVLFLLFSGVLKLLPVDDVDATFAHLGLPLGIRNGLATLELGCTLLYALPRTRPLGAILLTGYLGGAIVTHLRVGDPWLTHTLFPLWVGALAWTGVLLRDVRLREALFLPLRSR